MEYTHLPVDQQIGRLEARLAALQQAHFDHDVQRLELEAARAAGDKSGATEKAIADHASALKDIELACTVDAERLAALKAEAAPAETKPAKATKLAKQVNKPS